MRSRTPTAQSTPPDNHGHHSSADPSEIGTSALGSVLKNVRSESARRQIDELGSELIGGGESDMADLGQDRGPLTCRGASGDGEHPDRFDVPGARLR